MSAQPQYVVKLDMNLFTDEGEVAHSAWQPRLAAMFSGTGVEFTLDCLVRHSNRLSGADGAALVGHGACALLVTLHAQSKAVAIGEATQL